MNDGLFDLTVDVVRTLSRLGAILNFWTPVSLGQATVAPIAALASLILLALISGIAAAALATLLTALVALYYMLTQVLGFSLELSPI